MNSYLSIQERCRDNLKALKSLLDKYKLLMPKYQSEKSEKELKELTEKYHIDKIIDLKEVINSLKSENVFLKNKTVNMENYIQEITKETIELRTRVQVLTQSLSETKAYNTEVNNKEHLNEEQLRKHIEELKTKLISSETEKIELKKIYSEKAKEFDNLKKIAEKAQKKFEDYIRKKSEAEQEMKIKSKNLQEEVDHLSQELYKANTELNKYNEFLKAKEENKRMQYLNDSVNIIPNTQYDELTDVHTNQSYNINFSSKVNSSSTKLLNSRNDINKDDHYKCIYNTYRKITRERNEIDRKSVV